MWISGHDTSPLDSWTHYRNLLSKQGPQRLVEVIENFESAIITQEERQRDKNNMEEEQERLSMRHKCHQADILQEADLNDNDDEVEIMRLLDNNNNQHAERISYDVKLHACDNIISAFQMKSSFSKADAYKNSALSYAKLIGAATEAGILNIYWHYKIWT